METRANHLLTGLFVLGFTAALIGFTLWVAKVELNESRASYQIIFSGSVTGLKEGSSVRYRGIPVGTVSEIRIDPTNVERVRVVVKINRDTPIKVDAIASLEVAGLTGNAFVQISGGTHAAPQVTALSGELAQIRSKPSALAEVFDSAPVLLHQVRDLIERLAAILSPDNQRLITASVGNLHKMSEQLTAASGDVTQAMVSVRSSTRNLDGLVSDIRGQVGQTAANLDATAGQVRHTLAAIETGSGTMVTAMGKTLEEVRDLSRSVGQLSDQMAGLIKENRVPVRDFTSVGLYELSLMIAELRQLIVSLTRVSAQIERGPVEFLFSGTKQNEDKK